MSQEVAGAIDHTTLHTFAERISQLEAENAALKQQLAAGGGPAPVCASWSTCTDAVIDAASKEGQIKVKKDDFSRTFGDAASGGLQGIFGAHLASLLGERGGLGGGGAALPPPRILEIGLGCGVTKPASPSKLGGGSVAVWRRLFPKATVFVAEYDEPCSREYEAAMRARPALSGCLSATKATLGRSPSGALRGRSTRSSTTARTRARTSCAASTRSGRSCSPAGCTSSRTSVRQASGWGIPTTRTAAACRPT